MRARRAAALITALALAWMLTPAAAQAVEPVDLGAGYVVDQADVLTPAEETAAQERLTDLYSTTGADLYVVFVDEFTDPSDRQQWADATAQQGGLGPSQYLLAVSVDGRQYYVSADGSGPLSDQQLTQLEADVRPFLSDDDFAGAVDAAADSMEQALSDEASGADDGAAGGAASGGGFPTGILIFLAVAAVIGVVVWLVVRARRRAKPVDGGGEPAPVPLEELERAAASALVETDDALKTSAQELGFARAQFGDAATVEFEATIVAARTRLDEAFALQQRLDDAEPDSPADIRAWNERIISLCDEANSDLDDKAAAFDELRKLEQNAPEALARVEEAHSAATAAIGAADDRLDELAGVYAPEALATVADNPDQARDRLAFAAEQLRAATAAIGSGEGGEAAVGIRAAEEAVGQAVLLEEAIDKLAADLTAAEARARDLVAELEADTAAAAALPDADGRLARAIAVARAQIDTARAGAAGTGRRPLATLHVLESVNAELDALTASVRDAQAQAERARQAVGRTILQAQAQVSAAEDYITARRGAVGATARTRLAESGAALVRAQQLQQGDPQQALQHAQRADQLAGQALQLAQSDVGAFGGGGGFGSTQPSSGGGGMLGAVLGGVLINSMLGGGSSSRSGGLGGSLGGMLGGGGRSGGARMRPGSFGGGGTRGRRGGGRF